MTRTSTPRGDVAKEKILSYAVQLFSQRGFDGFTTRELSAKAKVNIAAINYYFGHKLGLYEAAVEEVHRRLRERGNQVFASEVAPRLFKHVAQGGAPERVSTAEMRIIIHRVYLAARQEDVGIRLLMRQVLDGKTGSPLEPRSLLDGNDMTAGMISIIGTTFGVSAERARANIVAFGFLCSRYVVQSQPQLMAALGVRTTEDLETLVVDTLVTTLAGGGNLS
jgi:AcrR family transcriptional regulator